MTQSSGLEVDMEDISLGARILAAWPDALTPEQRVPDALAKLGELSTKVCEQLT